MSVVSFFQIQDDPVDADEVDDDSAWQIQKYNFNNFNFNFNSC